MATCWLVTLPRAYFDAARVRGFDLIGIDSPNTRKSRQMAHNDRIVFYIAESRTFAAAASVESKMFQGNDEVWTDPRRPKERFKNRVRLKPLVVAGDESEEVRGLEIGPTLEYVKRWPPEMWHLALFGMVHIVSQRDFDLLRTELDRAVAAGDDGGGSGAVADDARNDDGDDDDGADEDSPALTALMGALGREATMEPEETSSERELAVAEDVGDSGESGDRDES